MIKIGVEMIFLSIGVGVKHFNSFSKKFYGEMKQFGSFKNLNPVIYVGFYLFTKICNSKCTPIAMTSFLNYYE